MSAAARETDGVVTVTVSNHGLSKGWDIIDLDVRGRSVLPLREGKFSTKEQAIAAGYERGHAAIKDDNAPPGF